MKSSIGKRKLINSRKNIPLRSVSVDSYNNNNNNDDNDEHNINGPNAKKRRRMITRSMSRGELEMGSGMVSRMESGIKFGMESNTNISSMHCFLSFVCDKILYFINILGVSI